MNLLFHKVEVAKHAMMAHAADERIQLTAILVLDEIGYWTKGGRLAVISAAPAPGVQLIITAMRAFKRQKAVQQVGVQALAKLAQSERCTTIALGYLGELCASEGDAEGEGEGGISGVKEKDQAAEGDEYDYCHLDWEEEEGEGKEGGGHEKEGKPSRTNAGMVIEVGGVELAATMLQLAAKNKEVRVWFRHMRLSAVSCTKPHACLHNIV
jgi:hypothetical protein